jgi:sugar lactone lactonase YvrE
MNQTTNMIGSGFRFTECPRWHRGELYFVDMYDRRVCRIDRGGTVHTVVEIDFPAGLGWLPGGDMLVVAAHECKIYRYDGRNLHLAADLTGRGLAILNDMIVTPAGDLYVGALATGFERGELAPVAVFHVGIEGSVTKATPELYGANGMVMTPDGKTLVVAESFASRLTAFDIASDGTLSNGRTWASFNDKVATSIADVLASDAIIPDGIAIDAEAAIWMADARGGGAMRVAEGGEVLERRTFGTDTAIATALGGDDLKILYVMVGPPFARAVELLASTERRYSVYACPVSVAGFDLPA